MKFSAESNGAGLRRVAPPLRCAAIHLRRTSSGEGVKPAGQNIGARPAYIFESKTL